MLKKHLFSRNQIGRTMLEMLAVLGIVGILTLTALYGYRYAMATGKAQRAFKDVMLRSAAIASSASFEQEEIGRIPSPIGYDETSGGMDFEHHKLANEEYTVAVSPIRKPPSKPLSWRVLTR